MKQHLHEDDGDPSRPLLKTNNLLKKGKFLLLSSLIASAFSANAQITDSVTHKYRARDLRTWSVGVFGGVLTQQTPFSSHKNADFRLPVEAVGYGISVKKQLIHTIGLQLDVMRGEVKGKNMQVGKDGAADIITNSSYSTDVKYLANFSLEYTFANFRMSEEFGLFGIYAKAGGGYMGFKAKNQNSGNSPELYREAFTIPVGIGTKIGLVKGINLDLGYTVNFIRSDRFDGYNDSYETGHTYDKFAFGYAGLEFALGNKNKHQLSWYNPSAAGNGGTPYDDTALKRAVARLDSLQKEDRARYDRELGDADKDGVANKFDKCPNTPDSVRVDGAGCPLPKFAADILKDAFDNLEFEFGKANIRSSSYPSLDKLAGLLKDHGYTLKISGHTDNVGSDKFNLKLSKDRAEAVKTYLTGKGAIPSKIEATGYGEFQPITTNDTPEGRQKNRRVELTLY